MPKRINAFRHALLIACALLCICFLFGCDFNYASIFCNHAESDWIIDSRPTLESEGKQHTECTKCGEVIQTQAIPELEYSLSEAKQMLNKSIVKVYCYDYDGETLLSQGTGFFIDKLGKFITNAHVVENAYYIKIKTSSGATYDVNVMYAYNDRDSDHAICKALGCPSTPVEFDENVFVGDTVYAFGYPNDALTLSSTQGVVTSTNVVDKNKTYIENTAKIDHGSSGGVLVNTDGKVVGITTGILKNGKYAALSYSEVKTDAEKTYYSISAKEPVEWFHDTQTVTLNAYNFDTYFNVSISPTPLYGGDVRYDVTISLKPLYQYKKIKIKYTSLWFSVEIDTNYEYYSASLYSGGWSTSNSTCYTHIVMYDRYDMMGESSTATASFYYSNYTKLYYSYDYDISSAIGTFVIYD